MGNDEFWGLVIGKPNTSTRENFHNFLSDVVPCKQTSYTEGIRGSEERKITFLWLEMNEEKNGREGR